MKENDNKTESLDLMQWVHQTTKDAIAMKERGECHSLEGMFTHVAAHQTEEALTSFLKLHDINLANPNDRLTRHFFMKFEYKKLNEVVQAQPQATPTKKYKI